jgi:hypothetical protein
VPIMITFLCIWIQPTFILVYTMEIIETLLNLMPVSVVIHQVVVGNILRLV